MSSMTMTQDLATTPDFTSVAETLDAISDPTRLELLWLVAARAMPVHMLCEAVGKRQQAVSHHLTILKLRGLVSFERRGKSNVYHATDDGRLALSRAWA